MSALPKYEAYPEYNAAFPLRPVGNPNGQPLQPVQRQAEPTVETLVTPVIPQWVVRLEQVKRCSTLAASACVLALVPVYGMVVTTQSQWSQGHQNLQNFERQEQQLTTARAQMRSQIVDQAQQQRHLVQQMPASSIFLRPAPSRPVAVSQPAFPSASLSMNATKPLSY